MSLQVGDPYSPLRRISARRCLVAPRRPDSGAAEAEGNIMRMSQKKQPAESHAPRSTFGLGVRTVLGLLVLMMAAMFSLPAIASAADGPPTISSDQADYPPGATVVLTGTNWQAGEVVHITVNDDAGKTWKRDADVTADGAGGIADTFNLPDWFVALYTVTASGPLSGAAQTTFTDAVNSTFTGKDGLGHFPATSEEDLGTVGQAANAISLTCPRGTGLTARASGLGNSTVAWNVSFLTGYGNNAALSSRTTLTPTSGSFSSGADSACVAMAINTSTLALGTYQGQLRLSVDA